MTTANLLPSSVVDRLTRRAGGAVLALLVQALFVAALLLWAVPPLSLARTEKEITFHLLPAASPMPPPVIGAPVAPPRRPTATAPAPSTVAPSVSAPPSGIAGFGQSLFGCAPENYANLAPDARAHCVKPGEGLAYNSTPNPMGRPSRVKDEAHWEEEFARKTSPTMICPALSPGCLAMMILSGKITDPRTWPRYEISRYGKEELYKLEQAYDAFNRQYAKAAADCVPETPPDANKDRQADARSPCPAPPSAAASVTSPVRKNSP